MEYLHRPRPLNSSAYEQALGEFVSKFSAHPDVLGIYQFGSVRNPGISDLDFIVVVRETLSQPITPDYRYDFFSEETSFILSHNPIVVPEDLLPHLWKLYPILGDVKCHYGQRKDKLEVISDATEGYVALNLMGICFQRYPWQFLFMRRQGLLHVRRSMQAMNALRHAHALCARLGLKTFERRLDFFEDLDRLQHDWFRMPVEEGYAALERRMDEATETSAAIVKDLALFMKTQIGNLESGSRSDKPSLVGKYNPGSYIFLDITDDCDLLSLTERIWIETGLFMGVLPKEFIIPLLLIVQSGGEVGREVAKNLLVSARWQESISMDAYHAGRDTARHLARLYSFFKTNPIHIPMEPDLFLLRKLAQDNRRASSKNAALSWLAELARSQVQFVRLRRAGLDTTKYKLREPIFAH